MREAFAETVVELGARDRRVVLLTGDLGFTVLEPFAERFPDRYFNVGVAEQNMVGLATGLAEAGFVPYVYSIATFATMRPYEFVRNGPVLHELPVRLVGVGAGFDYGHNGVTHYALEDVALTRVQPDLAVIVPADAAQTRAALLATADVRRPIYFRLGKESPPVPGLDGRFRLGCLEILRSGHDVALVAMGALVLEAISAAERLAEDGVDAAVAVVSSFNPSPGEEIADLLSSVPAAIALEAHYTAGGLGSLLCEIVAERGIGCKVARCGVERMPRGDTGSANYLHKIHGLDGAAVARMVRAQLKPASG